MAIAVYRITNIKNGKIYIGSTIDTKKRWWQHRSELRCNRHANPRMQEDADKYGVESFKFEILELCNRRNLRNREADYINQYRPEYNSNPPQSKFGSERINVDIRSDYRNLIKFMSEKYNVAMREVVEMFIEKYIDSNMEPDFRGLQKPIPEGFKKKIGWDEKKQKEDRRDRALQQLRDYFATRREERDSVSS